MKAYERRAAGAYPFFKLATWDERSMTWRAGKVTFESEGDAYASTAGKRGKFRVERFDEDGSEALTPFAL